MFYPFAPKSKTKTDKNLNERNDDYIKMIKETLKDSSNDNCVECGANNPQYISINNSIFLCKDCILNHLQLPQEASTIIKNDLKILNMDEIQYIYNGGNKKLLDFINNEFPKLKEFPPQKLYNTKAMDYYRKNLKYLTEGGSKPIKPGIKEAYELNIKNEQNDISDMDMDNEDPDDNLEDPIYDNIYELNDDKNEAFESEKGTKKYYYSTCYRDKKIINDKIDSKLSNNNNNSERYTLPLKIKHYSLRNFNFMQSPRNSQFTHSQKEVLTSNKKKENEIKKNDNIKNKQNTNKTNIQSCQSSKNIKFTKNYTNFDNDKYYNNTSKGSDTIELYFNNNSKVKNNDKKDNISLNAGFLSPQFLSSNAKSPPTTCENKIKNNVYYKPKAIPFFTNYRTKSDFFKNDKKSREFNITEFNIDDKKNNLKESKKKIDIKDNNNDNTFSDKIKSIKRNNLNRTHKIKSKEEFEKNNKTYINTFNGNNNSKFPQTESFKILNSNRNHRHNMNINKKEEEEKSKEKNKENRKTNNTHISVNISHFKIISNINNYNINISNLNNDKKPKDLNKKIIGKTQYNFYKKTDNNNNSTTGYFSNKYLSNTANNSKRNLRIKNEDFKAETITENQDKKKIAQRLIDYQKNTDDENYSKTSHLNSLRSYQTFICSKPESKELNIFKYNSKLTKKNRESSEEKKHSFYNFRERYKIKNKDNDKKEYTIEIKKLDYKTNNNNNKTKDENLESMKSINESIRNKYKKKKLKNLI